MSKEHIEKEYRLWMLKNPAKPGKWYSVKYLKFITLLCKKHGATDVAEFLSEENKKGKKK